LDTKQAGVQYSKRRELGVAFFVAMAIALALPACETLPGDVAVGLSESASGNPELHYVLCPKQRILDIAVKMPSTDGESSVTVWEIRSQRGSTLENVNLGETPRGFRIVVPLSSPLSPDASILVAVRTTLIVPVVRFDLSMLRPGKILVRDGHLVSSATFRIDALKICPH